MIEVQLLIKSVFCIQNTVVYTQRTEHRILVLPGCYAAWMSSLLPTFRDNIGPILKRQAVP
jgi:hypothetical protein